VNASAVPTPYPAINDAIALLSRETRAILGAEFVGLSLNSTARIGSARAITRRSPS